MQLMTAIIALMCCNVYGQSAAETNIRIPVRDPTTVVESLNENTAMVNTDVISEILLSCNDVGVVNTPILCKVVTFDNCGNKEGVHQNASSLIPVVKLVAGSTSLADVTIFISEVVYKGQNEFRFQFVPPQVGIYDVSINATSLERRYRSPDSVLVAVRDLQKRCSELPRVEQTRQTLQSMLRIQDLNEKTKIKYRPPSPQWSSHTTRQFATPDVRLKNLQQHSARTASQHNLLTRDFNDDSRSVLPRSHLWPEHGHKHPNPLFPWSEPPPDTFPTTRDFFCQVGQRTLPDELL